MNPTQNTPASLVPHSLANSFGIAVDPRAMVMGYAPGTVGAPPVKPYVFDVSRLRDLLIFWELGLKALKLRGDPAAGKTSLVEQFHARLNWPLKLVSCSQQTEPFHLYGQLVPTETGTLRWVDGPVVNAARTGTSVLLDEFNTLDPATATSLNALLEGYSITIPETGEVITPAPGFRVFGTENSVTSRLSVAGRNVQDVANDDRWMLMEVGYLDEVSEQSIVEATMTKMGMDPEVAKLTSSIMVKTANTIRQRYQSGDPDVDKPMSTRVLQRWAMLTWGYRNMQKQGISPMAYSLPRAFACPTKQMAQATMDIYHFVSGAGI